MVVETGKRTKHQLTMRRSICLARVRHHKQPSRFGKTQQDCSVDGWASFSNKQLTQHGDNITSKNTSAQCTMMRAEIAADFARILGSSTTSTHEKYLAMFELRDLCLRTECQGKSRPVSFAVFAKISFRAPKKFCTKNRGTVFLLL
jgi:hypothetical protein